MRMSSFFFFLIFLIFFFWNVYLGPSPPGLGPRTSDLYNFYREYRIHPEMANELSEPIIRAPTVVVTCSYMIINGTNGPVYIYNLWFQKGVKF